MRRRLVLWLGLSGLVAMVAAPRPSTADTCSSGGFSLPRAGTDAEWFDVTYDSTLPDSGGYLLASRSTGSGTTRTISMRTKRGASGCGINLKQNDNIDFFSSAGHVGCSCQWAFDRGGKVIYMDGVALQGYGVPATRASGAFFSASSLQTGVATIASGTSTISPYPTDTAATYHVECWLNIRTAGSSSLNWTVAFTDDRGGAQTFTVPFTNASGTRTVSALTSTGYYYGEVLIRSQDYPSGTVTVSETGTSPTSHDGGAVILQVQGVQ